MVQTIQLVLKEKDKLVVNINIGTPSELDDTTHLKSGKARKVGLESKQRFHLRNHVHYGHQVNLGHHRTNSERVNQRQLLRSPVEEQPADWLEQIVQNKAKMIEMHAF